MGRLDVDDVCAKGGEEGRCSRPVAFGFGARFCLGANRARLELAVILDELLDRLSTLELVERTEPRYRAANFVCGYESLRVRVAS